MRKVHNLLLAPELEAARRIQAALARLGNVASDGRPILGLDSRDLLETVLEAAPEAVLIPAHIWTPWFSALGAQSGFDSIEECYRDLAGQIFAVETGLSSDPAMNGMCGFLDRFTLVSNSDAHSPENLGREANLLDTELAWPALVAALRAGGFAAGLTGKGFLGTVEFFPQEGKYHFDGHRRCGVRWDPLETLRRHGALPRLRAAGHGRGAAPRRAAGRPRGADSAARPPPLPLADPPAGAAGRDPRHRRADPPGGARLARAGPPGGVGADPAAGPAPGGGALGRDRPAGRGGAPHALPGRCWSRRATTGSTAASASSARASGKRRPARSCSSASWRGTRAAPGRAPPAPRRLPARGRPRRTRTGTTTGG